MSHRVVETLHLDPCLLCQHQLLVPLAGEDLWHVSQSTCQQLCMHMLNTLHAFSALAALILGEYKCLMPPAAALQ